MPDWLPLLIADPETETRGFNLRFDLKWMAHKRPKMLTMGARNIQDDYVKELLVSQNRGSGGHNLQATVFNRLGIELAKDIDHNVVDWTGELSPEMIDYAIEDVFVLPDLDAKLNSMIAARREQRPWRIESNAVFPTAAMELNGFPIDKARWQTMVDQWKTRAQNEYEELFKLYPSVMNWDSHVQIRKALTDSLGFDPGGTAHEVLVDLLYEYPDVKHIIDYKEARTRLKNWGDSNKEEAKWFSKKIHPLTGRIHPSWWQLSTMTGRYSCTKPNMQNIPREGDVRGMFRAPDGWAIISCDYEQIEMLVASYKAPDPLLLKLFREGLDTHSFVASLILNMSMEDFAKLPPAERSSHRQIGKSANFGLLFGMGARRFQVYSMVNFGVRLSFDEAQAIIDKYFGAFRGLQGMRDRAFRKYGDPRLEEATISNLIGAKRVLEGKSLKATTALNTPIQSTAGYGIKQACGLIMDAELLPWFVGQVHDELIMCAPRDRAQDVGSILQDCMVRGMKAVLGQDAPVRTSLHIGPSWAKDEEW